jgi:soluble lytic murein transglycosylase-like protein
VLRRLLLFSLASTSAFAADGLAAADGAGDDARVHIGPALRGEALALPDDVVAALIDGDVDTAAAALVGVDLDDLSARDRGDWAFLTAWTLVRAGRGAKAAPYLTLLDSAEDAPESYVALVRGEVLRATDEPIAALEAFAQVPEDSGAFPRAAIGAAEVLRDLGRTEEAFAAYVDLAARPDPTRGTAVALMALAQRAGGGSPEARPLLERLWTWYPGTSEGSKAESLLAAYDDWRPSWREATIRGEQLMDRSWYRGAVAALAPFASAVEGNDELACRFRYTLGRSRFKTRDASGAVAMLDGIGADCRDAAPDAGARGQYVLADALARSGQKSAALDAWIALGELYPDHTYGDDGFVKASELVGSADPERAEALVLRGVREHPRGDNAADAALKVAFARYASGDAAGARELALDIAKLPLDGAWVDVQGARYWAARWALYPDVDAPSVPVEDAAAKEEAIAGWRDLCEQAAVGFYAVLAHARLKEVAPEVASEVAARPPGWRPSTAASPWTVRPFMLNAEIREATALARLGALGEATALWEAVDEEALLPDEMAWWIESRIAGGDWLAAHDRMRKWLRTHPPPALGEHQRDVLRIAYPDRYWDEVQVATEPYPHLEARLLHALVREESNFNRTIRSHVGARGLAQLMPGTARETAGRLRMPLVMAQLDEPSTNLALGSKYLEVVLRMFRGSPYLSLAGYNAGPGRVNQWLGEWGNVPTDEFVERIPYKETRAYVKRVMGTWQIMRSSFDAGESFPDMSRFNHEAKLEEM